MSRQSSKGTPARSARENVLRVATTLARVYGLDKFSINAVSGELGLSKSTVYQRFGSRSDLVTQVVREYSATLRRDALAAANLSSPGIRRLITLLKVWLQDYVLQRGGCLILRGATECAGRPDDEIRSTMTSAVSSWRALLVDQLQAAAVRGEIPLTVDLSQLEFELFSFVLGVQHDWVFLGEPASFRAMTFEAIMHRHGVRLPTDVSLRL